MVSRKMRLHFTLGPVQGFVSQARRTRDLWAGSYLLSYLSGKAMIAIGGEIIFPAVDADPLMQALRGIRPSMSDIAAQVGSLPNRFVAKTTDEKAGANAVGEIKRVWEEEIAETVWKRYIARTCPSPATKEIWDRQIQNTWNCAWVIGDNDTLLDRRKNLRTWFVPDEQGEKCTVCGERQEISGKGLGSAASRKAMSNWWMEFRQDDTISKLDLRDNERLCAVCIVKRLFPNVAETAIGRKLPTGFPSVSYMAAVEWIEKVMECGSKHEIDTAVKGFVRQWK